MRYPICFAALIALAVAGCTSQSLGAPCGPCGPTSCDQIASRLDRGDWMVSDDKRVWKVRIAQSLENAPPRDAGYLVEKEYRQMRGGPKFKMYSVTSMNRDEQLGHIDSLGRAVRYEPQRNYGFKEVPAGTGTLENNVGSIFNTVEMITLESTSERRIAFENLDRNKDGLLQMDEAKRFGSTISRADANQDGLVDFDEFSAIDAL